MSVLRGVCLTCGRMSESIETFSTFSRVYWSGTLIKWLVGWLAGLIETVRPSKSLAGKG